MDRWLLKIELDGEWEECAYRTRSEALGAFLALINDYANHVRKAVLFSPERKDRWGMGTPFPISGLIH